MLQRCAAKGKHIVDKRLAVHVAVLERHGHSLRAYLSTSCWFPSVIDCPQLQLKRRNNSDQYGVVKQTNK